MFVRKRIQLHVRNSRYSAIIAVEVTDASSDHSVHGVCSIMSHTPSTEICASRINFCLVKRSVNLENQLVA